MSPEAEKVLTELHTRCGRCNHCGKKSCAGKASGSSLPSSLTLDDFLAALNAAFPVSTHKPIEAGV
jgi:hypothetical protein